MDQNLHVLFERVLGVEPAPPPEDLAREAMTAGTALRRRRGLAVGAVTGFVTVVATLVALNMTPTREVTPPVVAAGALAPSALADCDRRTGREATEVRVFLRQEVTDRQRLELQDALRSDARVRTVTFQSREAAYAAFKERYRDSPDLIAAVTPEQLPEAFHVTLARAADFSRFVVSFHDASGVDEIMGGPCPTGSGLGEHG
ncbi:permease-like cell division protein FtsX [Micromonospora auratinigra]|uniref:VirB8 protein n=1 Tax=Micromonospora auratinigra TaxID=261654 RepID=A0A1A8ZZE1_9ACTN|nr:permease-like cell division protein FtsX [Micromonospora auratinigra]SBT49256.1 VirB8 protein [Micromonospora auratinigra]